MTQPGKEVNVLAQLWGQPQIVEQQIPVAPDLRENTVLDFFSGWWGEVVMVVRRAVDGRVWVMPEESFPRRLYSLPAGGIRHGESIVRALRRELEVTGFDARLERFLATVRYELILASGCSDEVPCFFSHIFLLKEVSGNEPAVIGGEKIVNFEAVAPGKLLDIARQWRGLSGENDRIHDLATWGRFRSIAHQVVGETLGREEMCMENSLSQARDAGPAFLDK